MMLLALLLLTSVAAATVTCEGQECQNGVEPDLSFMMQNHLLLTHNEESKLEGDNGSWAHRARAGLPQFAPKAIFVHIPKTAGTSFNDCLRVFHVVTNVSFRNCGVPQSMLRQCLPLIKTQEQLLTGEFVATEFLELWKESSSANRLWTFLRNPLKRSVSQLEMFNVWFNRNASEGISNASIEQFLLGGSCPWDEALCNTLQNPNTCFDDPCNQFRNYQSGVLGDRGSGISDSNLNVAKTRLKAREVHVMITEFFEVSVCLFLDHNLDVHDGMDHIFDKCCLQRKPECDALFNRRANSRGSSLFYWDKYFYKPEFRKTLVQGTRDDCELYRDGLKIFEEDVRSMEKKWQFTFLPSKNVSNWSCESWLADYVAEHSR